MLCRKSFAASCGDEFTRASFPVSDSLNAPGFEQAHISNFLNRKRSLSVEGMNRVLAAANLSLYDLLSRDELNSRASPISASEGDFENVVLTDPEIGAPTAAITRANVRDILKFKKSFCAGCVRRRQAIVRVGSASF